MFIANNMGLRKDKEFETVFRIVNILSAVRLAPKCAEMCHGVTTMPGR